MSKRIGFFLGLLLVVCLGSASAEPIKLHPSNPHYYLFNGQPTILITSAEHYGGVINGDFDYVSYFDALKAYGMNYTRIYAGAMFEPIGKFIDGNPLGPKPQSLILPWAQTGVPGYLHGGNKFDLDKWNPAYFERLKDFIVKAGERGIVVEICFFNAQYSDTWPISPLFYENNIQGEGKGTYQEAQTLRHADTVRRESDYVRKITQEVNAYDNVILEICDEAPDIGHPPTPLDEAGAWVSHLADVVVETEKTLPKKHLLAVQVEGPVGGPLDLSGSSKVNVIVNQYVWQAGLQMGGMRGLELEYGHNKPIEFNETDWYPIWYRGDAVADSRVEAWEFIVGGGGSFNHLNGRYTAEDPAGNTPDNTQILTALRSLRDFIYSLDFLKMSPDKTFVLDGIPAGVFCRGMSQPGKQYALYHHHSRQKGGDTSSYEVTPGDYKESLVLNLAGGTYKADWVDPASGAVLESETFTHQGGNRVFNTPQHAVDIALRIKRP
jgi:hypothetical protein